MPHQEHAVTVIGEPTADLLLARSGIGNDDPVAATPGETLKQGRIAVLAPPAENRGIKHEAEQRVRGIAT